MNNLFRKQYPYLVSTMEEGNYKFSEILAVPPKFLIIPSRFDFMAKLIYLDGLKGLYDKERSYKIYKNHILAFGGRKIQEAGNSSKNSMEKYINVFHSLYNTVHATDKNSIWCKEKPIPIDRNFMALDGAHRISCAYDQKQLVAIYYLKDYRFPYRYDYLFFRLRLVPESMLVEMALKYNQLKRTTAFKITYKHLFCCPFLLFTFTCRKTLSPVYMLKTSPKSFLIVIDNEIVSPSYVTNYIKNKFGKKVCLNEIHNQKIIDKTLRSFLLPFQKKEQKFKVFYHIKSSLLRVYFISLEIIKKITNRSLFIK